MAVARKLERYHSYFQLFQPKGRLCVVPELMIRAQNEQRYRPLSIAISAMRNVLHSVESDDDCTKSGERSF